jgi:glutathione S-transferase
MIKLVQFATRKNASVPNYSPFCVKLETLLRAMDIEFEIEVFQGNPGKFAKGKLPVIRDNGKIIEDSELIYHYLREQGHKDLDVGLSETKQVQSLLIKNLLEQSLSWCMVYHRWQNESNWQANTKATFFGSLPALLRLFVPNLVRKGVIKSLHAQGIGRFSPQQVDEITTTHLTTLATLLGEQNYFFGEQLTSVDCSAFGLLVNFTADELNPKLKALIAPHTNLLAFIKRVKQQLY